MKAPFIQDNLIGIKSQFDWDLEVVASKTLLFKCKPIFPRAFLASHSVYVATSTKLHGVKIDGFQKSKQKVPPLSLPCTKKSPFTPQRMKKNLALGGGDEFLVQGTVEELFAHFFGIYIKFGCKNPSILTPYNSVDIAS